MLSAVIFKMMNDGGHGMNIYRGIVENTAGTNFNNMCFRINLLDEEEL